MYLIKWEESIGRNIQWTVTDMLKNLNKHSHIPLDSDRAQERFTIKKKKKEEEGWCYAMQAHRIKRNRSNKFSA